MSLSIGVTAVLERMRVISSTRSIGGMEISYYDDVTPERLIACGFKHRTRETTTGHRYSSWHLNGFEMNELGAWKYDDECVPAPFRPLNMGDVWERCMLEQ
jgi:hypothetical protein